MLTDWTTVAFFTVFPPLMMMTYYAWSAYAASLLIFIMFAYCNRVAYFYKLVLICHAYIIYWGCIFYNSFSSAHAHTLYVSLWHVLQSHFFLPCSHTNLKNRMRWTLMDISYIQWMLNEKSNVLKEAHVSTKAYSILPTYN